MEKNELSTLITSIEIVNLFEIFNYTMEYPNSENVLIITGPNGFGKTQVLNILYNLFNRNFIFFNKLVFETITINLSGNIRIVIDKTILPPQSELKLDNSPKYKLKFVFYENENIVETVTPKNSNDLSRILNADLPTNRFYKQHLSGGWLDIETKQVFNIEDLVAKYKDILPDRISKDISSIQNERTNQILNSVDVHLIREQRLFKKIVNPSKDYRSERDQTIVVDAIQTCSTDLKHLLAEKSQESFAISQSLDMTYPNRLIGEKGKMSKENYNVRFAKLTDKQKRLAANGLYDSNQIELSYSKDDSKALLVYLNDLEQKLSVFDDLLIKLELFTSILNERRFTFKSIVIDREKGFFFKTSKGKILELNELSSGEQHEVSLLYELIFKTKPGILVLIDEPEISLHITWQKEFLDDLLKIIKIQNFQVLIATHSHAIINDRWDLVYNLEKREV